MDTAAGVLASADERMQLQVRGTAHVGSAAAWHAAVGCRGRTDRIWGSARELQLI